MTICYAPVGTNIPIIIKWYDWNRIRLNAGIYNPNSLSVKHYRLRLDFNFRKIMALVHMRVGLWRALWWGEMGLSGKTRPVRKCPGGWTPRSWWRVRSPWLWYSASWAGPGPVSPAGEGKGRGFCHDFCSNRVRPVAIPRSPHQIIPGASSPMRSLCSHSMIKGPWKPTSRLACPWYSSTIRHFLLTTLSHSEESASELRDLLRIMASPFQPDCLTAKPLSLRVHQALLPTPLPAAWGS